MYFEGEEEENDEKCEFDAVYVFENTDYKSNRNFSVFCGIMDNSLPDIQSKSNTLYVQFISDSRRNNEGFVAEIVFTYGKLMFYYFL